MLVLSRKKGEAIVIGEDIEISIVGIKGDRVRLSISAPRDIPVWRKEVYVEIANSNQEAKEIDLTALAQIQKILK